MRFGDKEGPLFGDMLIYKLQDQNFVVSKNSRICPGKNVFHWENISVDSAKINWDKIKKEGKKIKHFYVELGNVKDMSRRNTRL
jgi:hypothetical protein